MICSFAFFLFASGVDNVAAAKSALEDGLPSVAIHKLEGTAVSKPDPDSVLTLARAYLADGKAGMAVQLLETHPAGKAGDFWLAQAYAELERYEEALRKYQSCREGSGFSEAALLGEARMLRNLGRSQAAIDALKSVKNWPASPLRNLATLEIAEACLDLRQPEDARRALDSLLPANGREKSRRDYLLARASSLTGDDAAAIVLFDSVVPIDPSMAVGVAMGKAHSLVLTGQSPAAENLLEDFISKNSDLPELERVFPLLDAIYAAQPAASMSELKRWTDDPEDSMRKKFAGFYLARFEARAGREDRVVRLLENVVNGSDKNPSLGLAFLELAKIRLKQSRPMEAIDLLPAMGESPQADFLRGLALAKLNEPLRAADSFIAAASDEVLAESALYNAAICEILTGDTKAQAFSLLKERLPKSPKLDDLRLKKGYGLAKGRNSGAPEIFESLSKTGNPGITDAANLALAEWTYEQNDRVSSANYLQRVSTSAGEVRDPQSDALAVFLADDGVSDESAIAAARKFLAGHADTPSEPEVMMKLGELLYRKGDFAGARVQFESLAKKYPGTPLEFPALFLAGQSASRLQTPTAMNDAMLLFEEVASSNNPLALRARFEQAVLQSILGKPNEAIVILDQIIASNGAQETRSAALMEKGKTLYSLGGRDPKSYQAAIDVWKQVGSDPASSPAWRNQALARIGSAYEKMGDSEAAVAAYYDVIKEAKLAPQAFFWFYKAGFAAARLLESSKRWDQAIQVYEKIAAAGGPRSEEATMRIKKLRLENFLWDENPSS
ncbi:MAG: tetratricopeptide repeat protein [Terrimicrobiaceae bacterium]